MSFLRAEMCMRSEVQVGLDCTAMVLSSCGLTHVFLLMISSCDCIGYELHQCMEYYSILQIYCPSY